MCLWGCAKVTPSLTLAIDCHSNGLVLFLLMGIDCWPDQYGFPSPTRVGCSTANYRTWTAAENLGSESLRSRVVSLMVTIFTLNIVKIMKHYIYCVVHLQMFGGGGVLSCLKWTISSDSEADTIDSEYLPVRCNTLNGLVWDGILRYHFIFSPHFYSLPHYLTTLAWCVLVPVLASSFQPTPPSLSTAAADRISAPTQKDNDLHPGECAVKAIDCRYSWPTSVPCPSFG